MALTSYHDDLERESEDTEETSEDDSDESLRDERMGGGGQHGHGHGGTGGRREHTEIREQMYQDKLAELKSQLAQLHSGQLVEYVKRMRKLEAQHRERQRVNDIIRDLEMEMVDREFFREKKAAAREFEEHKVYLREQLVQELEEKHKVIETERHNVELTGDSAELKTISTRKLRRRPNEQSNSGGYGPGEKRRKPAQLSNLNYALEDSDIMEDLKIINKNKVFSMNKHNSSNSNSHSGLGTNSSSSLGGVGGGGAGGNDSSSSSSPSTGGGGGITDVRMEDGKLFYQKRWFRRGQAVQVEPKHGEKFPGMISAIGSEAIWVRKTMDNTKIRIYLTQLAKGKFILKRRAA